MGVPAADQSQTEIIEEILRERWRQHHLHGGDLCDDRRTWFDWWHTLTYQTSKIILSKTQKDRETYIMQLAAVCFAILESSKRKAAAD